jgi:hypothetical protein
MKWLNGYTMRIVLVGCVAAIVLGGRIAKADFIFGEPTNLGPTINTSYGDGVSSISADGLSLHFCDVPFNPAPGGYGGGDMWVRRRDTTDDEWGTPMNLGPTVNTSSSDGPPCVSADGLSLYFSSNRPGGYGNYDLWMSTRTTTKDDWSAPVNLGPTVNSSADECFPSISADGLELYFADEDVVRPGGYGSRDVWVTTRPTVSDPWGPPMNLGPTVNSSASDGYGGQSISADGLSLYFTSNRPGGLGGFDIWVTRRATVSDPWAPPVNLGPPINSFAYDFPGNFSADGSTLYFTSLRPGGFGNHDLWQVSITPIVDFNGDGIVDSDDICIMVDYWGTDGSLCDVGPMPQGDGIVDVEDLIILAEHLFTYPGAVAYWKLDETEGILAADSVGSVGQYDAVVIGGATWQPNSGQIDGALQLDGVDGCAIAGAVLNPADGPFSVFAWVKGGAPGQVLVSQALGANWLSADSSEGNLMTELKESGRSAAILLSQAVITDGNWHRIGLVWDGTNRILYVDDVAVAADTQSELVGSNGGLNIGCGENLEPGSFWSGLIDDVRIYNRAVEP